MSMRSKLLLFVFIALGAILAADAREIIKDQVSVHFEEIINGRRFVYRAEILHGVRHDAWTIDGNPVSRDHFDESALEAEKEERRIERSKESQMREFVLEERQQARMSAAKRDLEADLKECMQVIRVVHENGLEESMPDRTIYRDFVTGPVERAKRLVSGEDDASLVELEEAQEELSAARGSLRKIAQAALQCAIDGCADTKRLKELLEVSL